jgi:hypothetical protein
VLLVLIGAALDVSAVDTLLRSACDPGGHYDVSASSARGADGDGSAVGSRRLDDGHDNQSMEVDGGATSNRPGFEDLAKALAADRATVVADERFDLHETEPVGAATVATAATAVAAATTITTPAAGAAATTTDVDDTGISSASLLALNADDAVMTSTVLFRLTATKPLQATVLELAEKHGVDLSRVNMELRDRLNYSTGAPFLTIARVDGTVWLR